MSWESLITIISTIAITLATTALVLLTGRYVRLTKAMVNEMKTARGPLVFIDFIYTGGRIELAVGNAGSSPAKDINFFIEEDISWIKNGKPVNISEIGILKNGIKYLPPGRTLKFLLHVPDWEKVKKKGGFVRIKINYQGEISNEIIESESVFDMMNYNEVLFDSYLEPEEKIVSAIHKMSRKTEGLPSLDFFSDAFGKKQCPMCGERIPSEAKKCPCCHEFIEKAEDRYGGEKE